MAWDPIWEKVFSEKEWGKYPPEELIRFVARNFYSVQERSQVKILEIGCGTGANVWYLAREGFDVYGIDGSATALERAGTRLQQEGLTAHLQVADILSVGTSFPGVRFDAVIDVGCLQCNRIEAVEKTFSQIFDILRPGGKFFGIMSAEGTYGEGLGEEVEPHSFRDVPEGPLAGFGLVHLFTFDEIDHLMSRFYQAVIEYSLRTINNRGNVIKNWVAEGEKPR